MRTSDFWERLEQLFPAGYAHSWAQDQVLVELDQRTVAEALADGVSAKRVWRAVCSAVEVPTQLR